MSDLTFQIEGELLSVRLARVPPAVAKRAITAVTRLTYALREMARSKYDEAGLQVRTGALKNSIEALPIRRTEHEIIGTVVAGQKLKYAKIHEFGGIIKPINAAFLAIPIGEAKTAAGVARFSPRQITAAGYDGSFVKGGILFGKRGKDAVPLFVLRSSVKIPARPFMRPALAAIQVQARSQLREAVHKGIRE